MIRNIYISLKCSYLLIIFVFGCIFFFEVESFTPARRLAHSSILIGNKIYFFGGTNSDSISNELFYLDVSQPFNVANPPWFDLSGIPFGSAWATVVLNDIDNDPNIYLFGGFMLDMKTLNDSFK